MSPLHVTGQQPRDSSEPLPIVKNGWRSRRSTELFGVLGRLLNRNKGYTEQLARVIPFKSTRKTGGGGIFRVIENTELIS